VLTWEGHHELDASIMSGGDLAAGAVAGVKSIKNPIEAARAVMLFSPHVLLAGEGADAFAGEQGLERVDNSYFTTPRRRDALERYKSAHVGKPVDSKFGTVGVVVLDREGNLAAGTSTGGMTGKRWGRVGDAPLIGAGTYADNGSCAVSATGHGEYFIRWQVASDICSRMKYTGVSLQQAATAVIYDELVPAGGEGGVIAVDPEGNVAMVFNTEGMYRASIDARGVKTIGIYKNEGLE
jgi:beta-aspartyl-peptidase (threonine type)